MPKIKKLPVPQSPALLAMAADPDLVDRIFEFVAEQFPEIGAARLKAAKAAARDEFRGEECYIPERSRTERQQLVAEVLALFNGRNASEVARRLKISRATVYRVIKQPLKPQPEPVTPSQFSET